MVAVVIVGCAYDGIICPTDRSSIVSHSSSNFTLVIITYYGTILILHLTSCTPTCTHVHRVYCIMHSSETHNQLQWVGNKDVVIRLLLVLLKTHFSHRTIWLLMTAKLRECCQQEASFGAAIVSMLSLSLCFRHHQAIFGWHRSIIDRSSIIDL
jgi:hypothetical protein